MAEVGLLPFARVALEVSKAVLPRYRSRFSKRLFNQPQLLAILCLMRYEDWTFREAEVRLGEHRELRQALGLASVPDFTTLYRFLQRLDDVTIDRAVGETVRRLRGARKKNRRKGRVAVDATGLAQGAVSTFFVRRMHHHGQKTASLAALAEVGHRGRFGPAVLARADRATRPVERLCEFACRRPDSFPANTDRAGAGRRRVRQREKSYLYPKTTRCAERDSGQAREENLARPRRACRDAPIVSTPDLPPPGLDRNPLFLRQTQTLGPGTWSHLAHAKASSSSAWSEFQPVSPQASLTFLEDVNRARWLLVI
jgi:Transposase domain (DUF772)